MLLCHFALLQHCIHTALNQFVATSPSEEFADATLRDLFDDSFDDSSCLMILPDIADTISVQTNIVTNCTMQAQIFTEFVAVRSYSINCFAVVVQRHICSDLNFVQAQLLYLAPRRKIFTELCQCSPKFQVLRDVTGLKLLLGHPTFCS